MDELKKAMEAVQGHLQELDSSQRMTLKELGGVKKEVARLDKSVDGLRNSVTLGHAATTALAGTFASIEQILTRLLSDDETLKTTVADLVRRVEALEEKAG